MRGGHWPINSDEQCDEAGHAQCHPIERLYIYIKVSIYGVNGVKELVIRKEQVVDPIPAVMIGCMNYTLNIMTHKIYCNGICIWLKTNVNE